MLQHLCPRAQTHTQENTPRKTHTQMQIHTQIHRYKDTYAHTHRHKHTPTNIYTEHRHKHTHTYRLTQTHIHTSQGKGGHRIGERTRGKGMVAGLVPNTLYKTRGKCCPSYTPALDPQDQSGPRWDGCIRKD